MDLEHLFIIELNIADYTCQLIVSLRNKTRKSAHFSHDIPIRGLSVFFQAEL